MLARSIRQVILLRSGAFVTRKSLRRHACAEHYLYKALLCAFAIAMLRNACERENARNYCVYPPVKFTVVGAEINAAGGVLNFYPVGIGVTN